MPFTGDVDEFSFTDTTQAGWSAGWTNPQNPGSPDNVTITYASWSSTQISTAGFAGEYGQHRYVANPGDTVQVCIYDSAGRQLACASATAPG